MAQIIVFIGKFTFGRCVLCKSVKNRFVCYYLRHDARKKIANNNNNNGNHTFTEKCEVEESEKKTLHSNYILCPQTFVYFYTAIFFSSFIHSFFFFFFVVSTMKLCIEFCNAWFHFHTMCDYFSNSMAFFSAAVAAAAVVIVISCSLCINNGLCVSFSAGRLRSVHYAKFKNSFDLPRSQRSVGWLAHARVNKLKLEPPLCNPER